MRILLLVALATILSSPANSTLLPPSASKGTDATSVAFKKAINEFNQLSRVERKERIQELRSTARNYRKAKHSGQDVDVELTLLVILAVLLPPLAVYLKEGEINSRFWISLLLTLIFWLPGAIYSLLVVLNKD